MNYISASPALLPARAGVGFKPEHFGAIAADQQPLGFFEVHAENYMGAGGVPHAQLRFLRERYALSLHGVGLSIGSPEPLDRDHLARLRRLCALYQPESFSEHLAWSSHGGVYFNDLLPLPYTEETLAVVAAHVDETQTALGRRILIENPATYVRFSQSDIPETEFLTELTQRTGCGLLLDLNNVFVSARNHGESALGYLASFPLIAVGEIHLAGFFDASEAGAPLLIDSHGAQVADEVISLFEWTIEQAGPLPTLIEWDNDVPDWPLLLAEAMKAQDRLRHAERGYARRLDRRAL
ncbi:MNIO family bufferin maturase [Methylocella silvestris]|uniref:UPF0276 protein CR492_06295 n=1 Tax=Methylocella silvestris TaxID=199596 RepID=A0A2J7TJM9_METSI|nr:DUF692 domain-containing protein [Methylocella silvestris]PNG26978.1 hypothetical protein CR492_06295 [Methylocella silvestris]